MPSRARRRELDRLDEMVNATATATLIGWDESVLTLFDATRHLERLGEVTVALRCTCGKRLDVLRGVERAGVRFVDGDRSRYRPVGAGKSDVIDDEGRIEYRCPLRRCGAVHVLRRDRLTDEFIRAADRRGEINLSHRRAARPKDDWRARNQAAL